MHALKWPINSARIVVLERVKDILVDPEDHYQTRRVLLESVALMLEKFDEYKTIVPKVRADILGNARIKTVGKSNPCMVTQG